MQKKYLQLKPEHKKWLNERSAKSPEVLVDQEWLAIAEFGKHYGWAAVMAVLNNEIDGETMAVLLAAGRKVDASRLYDASRASLIGTLSGNSKEPAESFRKATELIVKQMRADNG